MTVNRCELDAETLETLFEPTVEVPTVLLLGATGCCCGVGCRGGERALACW